jgi:hypothetical protein
MWRGDLWSVVLAPADGLERIRLMLHQLRNSPLARRTKMKSDTRSKTTSRFALLAAVVALVTFGVTQNRLLATDFHDVGKEHARAVVGAPNVSMPGFGFGKVKNLYALVAPQVVDPQVLCEATVTQGGWGRTMFPYPVSNAVLAPGKVTFGGRATVDQNGDPEGQQQYADHNPVDPFLVHSVSFFSVICTGMHATMEGLAKVTKLNSFVDIQEIFQIDIQDVAEPGAGQDKYHIQLRGDFNYDSGVVTLEGGNVRIRQ